MDELDQMYAEELELIEELNYGDEDEPLPFEGSSPLTFLLSTL